MIKYLKIFRILLGKQTLRYSKVVELRNPKISKGKFLKKEYQEKEKLHLRPNYLEPILEGNVASWGDQACTTNCRSIAEKDANFGRKCSRWCPYWGKFFLTYLPFTLSNFYLEVYAHEKSLIYDAIQKNLLHLCLFEMIIYKGQISNYTLTS